MYSQLRCVSEALAELVLQWALGARYESTDTRRPQSSVIDRTLDSSGPRATDTVKWGWGCGSWRGHGHDGQNTAACLPGHEYPGTRAAPGRRSRAYPYPGSSPEAALIVPLGA